MASYFSPGFALWARDQGPSWDWGLVEVVAQLELGLSLGSGLSPGLGLTQGHG